MMRVRDVMSARPVVVGEHSRDVRSLMGAAGVHHIPVIEGGRVLGVWIRSEEGPLVMLGPESVHETVPGADALDALRAVAEGAEAVVVWDAGVPAGVLTRTDLMHLVRSALDRGVGRRHPRPVVARLMGPAGCGKTTLLMRTLPLLGRLDVAVVQGNAGDPGAAGDLAGVPVVDAPGAHWRAGLGTAVSRLADAQLILVEDRDGPLEPGPGIGEDLQVAVVPAEGLAEMDPSALEEVAALVVTKADGPGGDQAEARLADLAAGHPRLATFITAVSADDRGLDAWARWLEGEVIGRRG